MLLPCCEVHISSSARRRRLLFRRRREFCQVYGVAKRIGRKQNDLEGNCRGILPWSPALPGLCHRHPQRGDRHGTSVQPGGAAALHFAGDDNAKENQTILDTGHHIVCPVSFCRGRSHIAAPFIPDLSGHCAHFFFMVLCILLEMLLKISSIHVKKTKNIQKMEKSFIKACKG